MASISTSQWVSTAPYIKLTVSLSSSTNTTATYSYVLQYIATSAASTGSVKKAYTVTINGSTVASGSYAINGKVGTYTITSGTTTLTKGSSSKSITYACSMTIAITWSGVYKGTISASGTFTLARMTYSSPSAPSSVQAARTSDATQVISWSGNNTSSSSTTYWSGVRVYRSTDGGSYSNISGSLGNSKTSYTDSTTSSGHCYKYYVQAYNSDATGTASSTVTRYTTPSAPSISSVTRSSDSSQIIKWTSGASDRTGVYIYRSVDGGTASKLTTISSNSTSSYTDSTTSAAHSYAYYLVAYNSCTGGTSTTTTLTSSSSSTKTVYTTPTALSTISVARNSDTSHKVTWTGTSNSAWVSTYIYRSTDGGSYTQLGTVSASTLSYTDTSTSAGHAYTYAVRPYNSTVSGSYLYASTVYTTPKAPSSVSLTKTAQTSVTVTVTLASSYVDSVQVHVTTDSGSTWTSLGNASGSGTSYTLTATVSGTAQFRARAVKASKASTSTTLYSSYTYSSEIETLCAPNAPSISALSSVYETESTITVSWTPNHPDGTAQSAADVQVTAGGTTTSHSISGTTSSLSIELTEMGTYTIKVRTYGLYEEDDEVVAGAWATVTTTSYYPPTVGFTLPETDAVLDGLPVEVEWESTDTETGIAAQSLYLYSDSGVLLYTFDIGSTDTEAELSGSTYLVSNNTSYQLMLTARGGSGLSSSATVGFSIAFAVPSKPSATIVVDEDLGATVTAIFSQGWYVNDDCILVSPDDEEGDYGPAITCGGEIDDAGVMTFNTIAETESVTVVRIDQYGERVAIADSLSDHEAVYDPLPPLNVDFSYELTGFSEEGTYSIREVSAYVDSEGMEAFNFGSDAREVVLLGYDASGSENIAQNGTAYHFALGEDTPMLPTYYLDGDLDVSGSHSYKIHDRGSYNDLRDIVRTAGRGVGWFRSYWGARARAYMTWALSYAASSHNRWDVSVNVVECVWEEPDD